MKKPKSKIPNRKPRAAPRGLNIRGAPAYVTRYLTNTAKAAGLSVEAYVRMEIIKHVDAKLNGTSTHELNGWHYTDHAEPNDVTGFIAAPPVG
jgi:hypothetical protein